MAAEPSCSNPFARLISGLATDALINALLVNLNHAFEDIFRFTVRRNCSREYVVFLEDTASQCPDGLLTLEKLEIALFDRLVLQDPANYIIPKLPKVLSPEYQIAVETDTIAYLFHCFETCNNSSIDPSSKETMLQSIVKLAARTISCPNTFHKDIWLNYFKLFNNKLDEIERCQPFLKNIVQELRQEENPRDMLRAIFYPVLKQIERVVCESCTDMKNADQRWLRVLKTLVFAAPELAEIVIDYQTPNAGSNGRAYENTLFGRYISECMTLKIRKSSGPWMPDDIYEVPEVTYHADTVATVFNKMLVMGATVRKKVIMWIYNCLAANSSRTEDHWYNNFPMLMVATHASDKFMIGLVGGVLLRFCTPMLNPEFTVLLVDPTFYAVPASEREERGIHMRDRSAVTCLLPTEEGEKRIHAEQFCFTSEFFFLTHKGIELSYSVIYKKCFRLSLQILKSIKSVEEAAATGDDLSVENCAVVLEMQMQLFREMKGWLGEPTTLDLVKKFHETSAVWLLETTAINSSEYDEMVATKSFAPIKCKNRRLPFDSFVPPYLKSIPQHILENLIKFINFSRQFGTTMIHNDDIMGPILQVILLFMGSVERARSAHLRATLAELLDCFVPPFSQVLTMKPYSKGQFDIHPDRKEIIPNLLNVFVTIEMTGQSVEVKDKFKYRRPMYKIIRYLWEQQIHVDTLKRLAVEAQENLEAATPPIFLRFVNSLINDATYLFDASFSNLKRVRDMDSMLDGDGRARLSPEEQNQVTMNFRHVGTTLKFENAIGQETVRMLQLITSHTQEIFCHPSMVDRLASMLNYILAQLVGPSYSSIKVQDAGKYNFYPNKLLIWISRIYIHLSKSNEFCLAVVQDDRSYSKELFTYAVDVLNRISKARQISEILKFDIKVNRIAARYKKEKKVLKNPPEEFLDPITFKLMRDPVILPISRKTVDRTTIMQHLLGDQTDPFNRSPLTMNEVLPNTKLNNEIAQWIKRKRRKYDERGG